MAGHGGGGGLGSMLRQLLIVIVLFWAMSQADVFSALHDVGIDPSLMRSIGAPIIKQIRDGEPFTRAGGGKFVHVDDVAAAMAAPFSRDVPPTGIYHLADCYARWSDWATLACEVIGTAIDIDFSSPPQPQNMFETESLARDLGVTLDRGHAGIRTHLEDLAARI